MRPAHQISGVEVPAREWWTCSIPSACARSGILAVCLIARRRNAAHMSMMPFSLVEMCAKSMRYNRRAYAPRTRAIVWLVLHWYPRSLPEAGAAVVAVTAIYGLVENCRQRGV